MGAGGGGGGGRAHTILCTAKNAVDAVDVPSRNNSMTIKKYNSHIKILFLYTHVLFFNSVIE
jgi:hypothetical protein